MSDEARPPDDRDLNLRSLRQRLRAASTWDEVGLVADEYAVRLAGTEGVTVSDYERAEMVLLLRKLTDRRRDRASALDLA